MVPPDVMQHIMGLTLLNKHPMRKWKDVVNSAEAKSERERKGKSLLRRENHRFANKK